MRTLVFLSAALVTSGCAVDAATPIDESQASQRASTSIVLRGLNGAGGRVDVAGQSPCVLAPGQAEKRCSYDAFVDRRFPAVPAAGAELVRWNPHDNEYVFTCAGCSRELVLEASGVPRAYAGSVPSGLAFENGRYAMRVSVGERIAIKGIVMNGVEPIGWGPGCAALADGNDTCLVDVARSSPPTIRIAMGAARQPSLRICMRLPEDHRWLSASESYAAIQCSNGDGVSCGGYSFCTARGRLNRPLTLRLDSRFGEERWTGCDRADGPRCLVTPRGDHELSVTYRTHP